MKFGDQSLLFQKETLKGFYNANKKLNSQCEFFCRPYYDHNKHRQAINYPFLQAAQCVGNVVSIAYGVYLFGKSIITFQSPMQALTVLSATLIQAVNVLLNACNMVLSLCSLVSRFVATLANGGYIFTPEKVSKEKGDVAEMGDIYCIGSKFDVLHELNQRSEYQLSAEKAEQNHCNLLYSFI